MILSLLQTPLSSFTATVMPGDRGERPVEKERDCGDGTPLPSKQVGAAPEDGRDGQRQEGAAACTEILPWLCFVHLVPLKNLDYDAPRQLGLCRLYRIKSPHERCRLMPVCQDALTISPKMAYERGGTGHVHSRLVNVCITSSPPLYLCLSPK